MFQLSNVLSLTATRLCESILFPVNGGPKNWHAYFYFVDTQHEVFLVRPSSTFYFWHSLLIHESWADMALNVFSWTRMEDQSTSPKKIVTDTSTDNS